jgi:inhibitor of cysteine peptidase
MKAPTSELKAKTGTEFSIDLPCNRTTGHRWEAHYDRSFMELLTSNYTRSSDKIGSGGVESFTFKALAKGHTRLRMTYKRPWEKSSATKALYEVIIDDPMSND